jgi:hypothetical protein
MLKILAIPCTNFVVVLLYHLAFRYATRTLN